MEAPAISLRPVGDGDRALLLELLAGARERELAFLPLSHEQKAAFVAQQLDAQERAYRAEWAERATFDVVLLDGEPIGRLSVGRADDELRLIDVVLLPPARGRGIGARLLRALLDEAAASGRSVALHVDVANPARRLYERLGFAVEEAGELYLFMRARPGA